MIETQNDLSVKPELGNSTKPLLPAVPTSEVYLEDCVQALKRYADNHFDLAIVDPPYGINADIKNNGKNSDRHEKTSLAKINTYKKTNWDNETPTDEYFNELKRVSKNQIVWGGNYFTEYLPPKMGWILWDKGQRDFSLADGELAWTSFDKALRIFEMSRGKALAKNNETGGRFHPTQKPIALYDWILHNYATCKECEGSGEVASLSIDCDVQTCKSCKGNVPKILDTHLGSGSSAIAAHKMGFDFVGCELDKDYYDAACKRFKEQTAQLSLL